MYVIKGAIRGQVAYYVGQQYDKEIDINVLQFSANIDGATKYDIQEDAERDCHELKNNGFKIYAICPSCGKEYEGYPALSRIDNKTPICSECGVKEALNEFIKHNEKTT